MKFAPMYVLHKKFKSRYREQQLRRWGGLAQRADSQYEYIDQLLPLHSARMFFHYPEEGALQQRRVALKARMRRFRTRLGILGLRR